MLDVQISAANEAKLQESFSSQSWEQACEILEAFDNDRVVSALVTVSRLSKLWRLGWLTKLVELVSAPQLLVSYPRNSRRSAYGVRRAASAVNRESPGPIGNRAL
jgi:hypothetical protein